MAKWLDKYEQGGLVLKKKTKDNFDLKANPNDVKASVGPGYVGDGYDTTGRNYSPAWGGQFQDGGALPEVTVYGHRNPSAKAYFDRWRKEAESWQDRESPVNSPMSSYLAGEQMYTKYKGHDIKMLDEQDRPMLSVTPFGDTLQIHNPESDYRGDSLISELAHKVQLNKKGNLGFIKSHIGNDYLNTLKNMSLSDIFNADSWKSAYDKNYYAPGTQEYEAHSIIEPKLREEFKVLADKEYEKLTPSKKKAMGGNIPGTVGFTYARTAGSAPANGKYTKKTKASAQNGKKLYGATDEEEESVKNFAKNYYASDRFKENLYDKGNFGIKDRSAQVSKDAINKINNLSYTYKPLDRTGFDKGNIINMGNPNEYLNAPKDLAFAHEMFHPMETEILSSQPRNVMVMLNHNALKNRKGDANALYQDMVDPLPTYIGGVAHYLPVGDKIQHEIKDFATNEQSLSSTSMHDDLIGEVRADIMALRYLANKKGIWDVTKSGVKDMTPEMLNELYKSPELNKQMYKSSSSGKTTYLPSKKAKEPGSLKAVDPPKNPGLMLDRLRQRYSDADLLYLMNKLAYESNNQDQTIAQNGKEMAFYQNGLDFKPKSISQNGVKKSKKSEPEVSPYKPVDASNANTIRSLIPAPLNISQALAKTIASEARLNETSLDDDQKLILWNTIQNARKRSGKQTGGGTQYSDYGDQGYGTGEDFDNWFNRGKIGALSGVYNSLTNPGFVMASTVGRGRYWTDPENPDDINYTDVYDWNTSEKNYKGGNAYQKIRNLVRSNEDKSLNKTKNDKTRMNIHLTKKEIDDIKARKEMKLSSLIAFDEGGVIKDDMGQWAHPGEITEIGSNNITMQGVDYPVLGVSDTGDTQMMYPGEDYNFDGNKVTEFPMMEKGGWLDKYKAQSGETVAPYGSLQGDLPPVTVTSSKPSKWGSMKFAPYDPSNQPTISQWNPKPGEIEAMAAAEQARRDEENSFYNNKHIKALRNSAFADWRPYAVAGGLTALPAIGSALGLGSTGAAMSTPIAAGITANHLLGAAAVTHGINKLPETSQSVKTAYNNPTSENIINAINDVGWNALDLAPAVPTLSKIGTEAKGVYNTIATGESALPIAWKSPAVGLTQEASADMFKGIANANKLSDADRALLLEYQYDSKPFTGRVYGAGVPNIDQAKRQALNNIIKNNELNFNNDAVLTRKFNPDNKSLGAEFTNGRLNLGDRPTSFSAGVGNSSYGSGSVDRVVVPKRYSKKMGDKFLANEYGIPSDKTFDLLSGEAKNFAAARGVMPDDIINVERELIGTGLDFKRIGKVKNDIGGYDYIVRPKDATFAKYLTEETPLKNAYKLNPYAFKPTEGMMYRGIGKEGMEDALQSGLFRAKQDVTPTSIGNFNTTRQFSKAYYSPRFDIADQYGQGFIAEVPREASGWGKRYGTKEWSQIAQKDIPITEGKVLQKDWLKRYKEVPKPTNTQRVTRGPINWWDEPKYKKQNPNFDPQTYLNNPVGNQFYSRDIPEGMEPRYFEDNKNGGWLNKYK
jgi:hypothetical protein